MKTRCNTPTPALQGRTVTTIEGLADTVPGGLHPVQEAWLEQDVAQCALLPARPDHGHRRAAGVEHDPSDADIDVIENVCRCGSYFRIRQAIKSAAAKMR